MIVFCINSECSEFNKKVEVEDWDGINSYSLFLLKQCPVCKRKRDSEEVEITEREGGFNVHFAKFSAMSPEDKKRVLKKRSQDHFKKSIKGKKEYMDRKFYGLER